MKRIFVIAFLLVALCGVSQAKDLDVLSAIKKIPDLKQGVAYSFLDKEFTYITTAEVIKKKPIALEVGYSAKDEIIGVVSFDLVCAEDYGIEVPILDLLDANVGIYAGVGRLGVTSGNNEFDWGVSLSVITLSF